MNGTTWHYKSKVKILQNFVALSEYMNFKMSTFCQRSYHRKCQRRGIGGQKIQNLVNVVCECPLTGRCENRYAQPKSTLSEVISSESIHFSNWQEFQKYFITQLSSLVYNKENWSGFVEIMFTINYHIVASSNMSY